MYNAICSEYSLFGKYSFHVLIGQNFPASDILPFMLVHCCDKILQKGPHTSGQMRDATRDTIVWEIFDSKKILWMLDTHEN